MFNQTEVFNQTQVPKRKLHLSPNEVFNQINTPLVMEQTRLARKSNELTPPKWRESTRNKLTPPLRSTPGETITPTPLHHERKKNVQFQEPIVNTGQVGNKGVYDPILITPKHYYNPSSSEGHPDLDKQDSPVGYSNQNRCYFSGMVENG